MVWPVFVSSAASLRYAWLDSVYMFCVYGCFWKYLTQFLRVLAVGTGPYFYESLDLAVQRPSTEASGRIPRMSLGLWTLFVHVI